MFAPPWQTESWSSTTSPICSSWCASTSAQAGFEVETARDGREGLEAIRRRRPDLVVLDLMLPDLSGTEVCRQLRADPELARPARS